MEKLDGPISVAELEDVLDAGSGSDSRTEFGSDLGASVDSDAIFALTLSLDSGSGLGAVLGSTIVSTLGSALG